MGKTGANAFMPRKKTCIIVAFISLVIFLASLITAIVLDGKLIKSERIRPTEGKFTAVTADGDDWFYTTYDSIHRMNADNEKTESLNLAACASAEGHSEIGEFRSLYSEASTEYIYAITNRGFLFQLEKGDQFAVRSMIALPGELRTIIERDGELYVAVQEGAVYAIYRYDAENLESGYLSGGNLYAVSWKKGVASKPALYTLEMIKQTSVLSFDVVEENGEKYVYMMYDGGLLKMHSDFEMNNWSKKIQATTDAEYAILEQEALQQLQPGEELDTKELQKQAKAKAYEALGIYSSQYGDTVLEIKAGEGDAYFDESQYMRYKADAVTFNGCAFVDTEKTYYMITATGDMVSATLDSLKELTLKNNKNTLTLNTETSMKLKGAPQRESFGPALHYNKDLKIGYVLYDSSNKVSRVNFVTKEIEFTKAVEFKISSIVQAPDESRIYYIYTNPNEAASGENVMRVLPLGGEAKDATFRSVKKAMIITAVIVAFVCLISALCAFKKGFDLKFAQTVFGIKKHWKIYVILAGSLTLLGMCCYYPAIGSITLSFFDYSESDASRRWNDFYNYKEIFRSAEFKQECLNMVMFLVVDLFVALLPPLIFAFFLTIMRNRNYSAVMRTLLFIPGVIPGVASALVWKEGIYGSYGVINVIRELLTGNSYSTDYLNDTTWTNLTAMMMMGFPFVGSYLIFYGAMMNVPSSYYEAAELDGITTRKRFFYIDVPLIFAQIKYVIVMSTISSVQNFGRIHTTTQGRNETSTPIYKMYKFIQERGEYGRGAAYATLLFIFLFIVTLINMRLQSKDKEV